MPDDPFDSPEWRSYERRVRKKLIPMVRDSAVALSIVPSGELDVKFAVELGFMIMLDKPIIAVVNRGAKLSNKLALVADAIVEGDIDDPDFQGRLATALKEVRGGVE